jgi:hypothetical protein
MIRYEYKIVGRGAGSDTLTESINYWAKEGWRVDQLFEVYGNTRALMLREWPDES